MNTRARYGSHAQANESRLMPAVRQQTVCPPLWYGAPNNDVTRPRDMHQRKQPIMIGSSVDV